MKSKSILGLNTVKAFVVVMLSLAIIGVIALVVLGQFSTSAFISQVGIPKTGTAENETVTSVTEIGDPLVYSNYTSSACTIAQCVNASDGKVVPAANYTVTGCTLRYTSVTAANGYNNTDWKCTYVWSYKDSTAITGVTYNVSNGVTGFFGNSLTFFALLGVVVIILIISLVVVVVNRFGGTSTGTTQGESMPSGEGNL